MEFVKLRIAVLSLCVLLGSSWFVACTNVGNDGKEVEKFVKQFFTYYIDNYTTVSEKCEEIANKYLTEEFGKSYVSEMKRTYPIDLLSCGLQYNKGEVFYGSINTAEYIGENKVKVTFNSPKGGQYSWILTFSKVGSEYRIANVKVK